MSELALLWLRRDLRLDDNPALHDLLARGARVIPLYLHAPEEEAPWSPGAASRWWLHHSLVGLDAALRARGSRLWIARGATLPTLLSLAAATGATRIAWNRLYDPATLARDAAVKLALRAQGLAVESHPGNLLQEPWSLQGKSGQPYRVFSAYWRGALARLPTLPPPLPAPAQLPPPPDPLASRLPTVPPEDLGLLPRGAWAAGLAAVWTPGEAGAQARWQTFLASTAPDYASLRDRPDLPGTSRLSPHLHFGEISPRRLLMDIAAAGQDPLTAPYSALTRELGWREFAHHLLYHFPDTTDQPLDPRFAHFPWRLPPASAGQASDDTQAAADLRAWQQGRTGIPLVDAGMRELWQTGWMHNRVRMVVASLLAKHLLLPWQAGSRWFWDTLVDADLANNTLGWQWTAGCGADAAPYFRIFNPVRQGERFDPRGDYVRRWIPELARLPDRFMHQPWTAAPPVLAEAGVRLGTDYPYPILELARARAAALAAFATIKERPGPAAIHP